MLTISSDKIEMNLEEEQYAGSPRTRILTAARALFFEMGFTRVSTDRLAKEARVSKASLYKHFPSMSAVLEAVVNSEGDSFDTGLPMQPTTYEELRSSLTEYGTALLSFLNNPEILQFCHLMHEEAREHPEVASVFYQAAYGRSLKNLRMMFESAFDSGCFHSNLSATDLAEQLMGSWESVKWTKALMGVSKKPFSNPKSWAKKCVDVLLQGATLDQK